MRKYIFAVILATLAFVGAASAQDTFVGVQYLRANPDVRQPSFKFDKATDSVGAVASITAYETKNIGLTAEGSANFNTGNQPYQVYTGLAGVTLKSRRYESIQPFVKGLAGVGIINVGKFGVNKASSDVGLAFKTSVGVDLGKGRVRYRLFDVGYLQTNLYSQRQDNFVVSTGIIF